MRFLFVAAFLSIFTPPSEAFAQERPTVFNAEKCSFYKREAFRIDQFRANYLDTILREGRKGNEKAVNVLTQERERLLIELGNVGAAYTAFCKP